MLRLQSSNSAQIVARGISLIVPTYNEAQNLPELFARIGAAFLGQADLEPELLIADDNSPDGTAAVARQLSTQLRLPVHVISNSGHRSLAHSVLKAAHAARHEVIVVLDADLSHSPEEAPTLGRSVLDRGFDVAIASRYVTGGKIHAWPLRRRLLSASGTWLARSCQRRNGPVRDPLSGYFACRRDVLIDSEQSLPSGFKLLFHILLARPDLRVAEHPSSFRDRRHGASKLGLRQHLDFLTQIVRRISKSFHFRLREV